MLSGSRQHLADEWGQSFYVPPYELDFFAPDEGINRWENYGPVACAHVCPFLQSFCDAEGIVCDERRLKQEAEYLEETQAKRCLGELEKDVLEARNASDSSDVGGARRATFCCCFAVWATRKAILVL